MASIMEDYMFWLREDSWYVACLGGMGGLTKLGSLLFLDERRLLFTGWRGLWWTICRGTGAFFRSTRARSSPSFPGMPPDGGRAKSTVSRRQTSHTHTHTHTPHTHARARAYTQPHTTPHHTTHTHTRTPLPHYNCVFLTLSRCCEHRQGRPVPQGQRGGPHSQTGQHRQGLRRVAARAIPETAAHGAAPHTHTHYTLHTC
jgi:hypothetical protein